MRTRSGIVTMLIVSLLAAYSCKSVETTSAMLHNEHGNYPKAIEMAKLAIENNPMDAEAHFQLGIAYSYTGDMKGAYAEFMKAAELNPKKIPDVETNIKSNWARHFNQGLSEFQAENMAGAAHEFELTTQADPRQIKGWLNLAKVYYAISDDDTTYLEHAYEAVDTLLAKTTEREEEYANVLSLAGQVMVRRGERDQAVAIFEKLLLDDPANYGVVETIGGDYLSKRDWENGALFLRMAVEGRRKTDSENFATWYDLGVAYFNSKDCDQAIEAYQNALEIEPENKAGNYSILLSYYQCELYDDAIVSGQYYVDRWGDDPNGWRILSLSYSKKGMKIKAEEAARKFQELVQ
jgi:tetratricopeptide (TPR) repeat protein